MTEQELLEKFKELGVLKTGHFRLTSGLHSAQYMQCAAVFEYPKAAEEIVKLLIPKLPQDIDTVMAPAIGESTWAMKWPESLDAALSSPSGNRGKWSCAAVLP